MENDKKSWYKRWWAIVIFVFIGLTIIVNLGGSSTDSNVDISKQAVQIQEEQDITVFDVEALYGKNIDEIRIILGDPVDGEYIEPNKQQLQLGTTEWNNVFKKDKYELLVTYNVESRNVVDFFIDTDDPSGAGRDTQKLERILNVQNSSNFIISPVESFKYPSRYTGITVTPKR
ncbi:MAG: hypothetical protein D4S01_11640 [Dehalococcoidia bacterium]|nr:MAG: hypothetical protein D4S01_11635 [Dehalococcoidia bacterium]TRZ47796.1 MAG: hypothetical protein D4S01_11640 [Dehalococcoidia bacterium]